MFNILFIGENYFMSIIILIVFILLFIFLLIVLPFKIKVSLHVNYLAAECFYLIYVFGINLLCGKACLNNGEVVVQNKTNKIIDKKKSPEMNGYMFSEIAKRLKVVNLDYIKNFGNDERADITSLISASENVLLNIIGCYLNFRCSNVRLFRIVNPTYMEDKNQTTLFVVAKLSLFDVIISSVKAKLKIKIHS